MIRYGRNISLKCADAVCATRIGEADGIATFGYCRHCWEAYRAAARKARA